MTRVEADSGRDDLTHVTIEMVPLDLDLQVDDEVFVTARELVEDSARRTGTGESDEDNEGATTGCS